jgi:D-3-phosphoglycerate dehydrogenase / 2-oxoglutarate reductase
MSRFKVLVTDPIDREGLKSLEAREGVEVVYELNPPPEKLEKALQGAAAWLVRSESKVTQAWMEKAPDLKLVGRAGVGIDNIDLKTATMRGIAVINAPAANTIAACEHAFGLMLALSRNIAQADADTKAGKWQRMKWMGAELNGKTLGVIGLGRIGREITKRAKAFGMNVVGFDPFVSREQADAMGVEISDLNGLLPKCDYITLHAPSSEKTKHLFNAEAFAKLKPGAKLINCARGDLIDEPALIEALKSGKLAGAALDVYEKEPLPEGSPLRGLANVVLTPHLGASTKEAQNKVAVELSQGVLDFFERGVAVNALNLPGFDADTLKSLGGWIDLSETLGRFIAQTMDSGLRELTCTFQGEFAPSQRRPLSVAALKGCLSTILAQSVNTINAQALATERGIRTSDSADPMPLEGFKQLLTVTAVTDKGTASVSGTMLAHEARVVRLGKLAVDVRPKGKMIVLTNQDRPGMIGRVGVLLGENGVNIADMNVGRVSARSEAVMVITVDEEVSPEVRKKLEGVPGITGVKWVKL